MAALSGAGYLLAHGFGCASRLLNHQRIHAALRAAMDAVLRVETIDESANVCCHEPSCWDAFSAG